MFPNFCFRKALTNCPLLEFLKFMEKYFAKIKVLDQKGKRVGQPPNFRGWRQTVNGLLLLWVDIRSLDGVLYLYTRRLNQDCLKNFFSLIRQRDGFCDNPTAKHFRDAFKQCTVNTLVKPPSPSKFQLDFETPFLLDVCRFSSAKRKRDSGSTTDLSHMQPLENISISSSEVEAIPEKHALKYVTNYLCRKYLQRHECKNCELQLNRRTNILIRS